MLFEPPLGGNIWLVLAALVPVILVLAYAWLVVQQWIEEWVIEREKKRKEKPP